MSSWTLKSRTPSRVPMYSLKRWSDASPESHFRYLCRTPRVRSSCRLMPIIQASPMRTLWGNCFLISLVKCSQNRCDGPMTWSSRNPSSPRLSQCFAAFTIWSWVSGFSRFSFGMSFTLRKQRYWSGQAVKMNQSAYLLFFSSCAAMKNGWCFEQ